MTKRIIILFLFTTLLTKSFAQIKGQTKQSSLKKNKVGGDRQLQEDKDPIDNNKPGSDISKLCKELETAPYVWKGNSAKTDNLVSNYAFRKLIRNNFNNLVLGNDNVSKIGRYATLDITDDNAFSFSPYSFESNPEKSSYQDIFSFNLSGQLNDDKFFKLTDYRDLAAGISYVHILNWTNYKTINRDIESIKKKYLCQLKEPLNELCKKYNKLVTDSSCTGKTKKKLYGDFIEEYTDLETELTEEFWGNKNFWWINIDAKLLGRDEFKFLYQPLLTSGNYSPKEETVFTPGISVGLNHFTKNNQTGNSFLFSIWAELNRKHSLSEIFEPNQFQSFVKVNDSLSQQKDLESVYITDFESIKTKWVADFGARVVGLLDISGSSRTRQIGLSFSFDSKGLVSNSKSSSQFRTEIGLVLPFLKADGESTFNLEIFRRWDRFSNFPADNDQFWGIRFNVPISSK
jgi:hypothetical protein